ncbi:Hypothetical protein SRAE_1000174500 [Strongyloides ratti]|uniref:Uncharacterized protein n=1 Tax=Strongyloides ratti TaxID=34506 RepID=A0A090L7I0_STRRB|nr:Hypothetical protein SRAE_1000174500 [Strongyloides ratti]CEF63484.1 Hypothetical protein SRAE_1000174500 [Strongyloides ratti]
MSNSSTILLTMPTSSHNFIENHHTSFYSENNLYENMVNFNTEFLIPCCSKYIDINETNDYPISSQSLPTSFFKHSNKKNYQTNYKKRNGLIKEREESLLFQKLQNTPTHPNNIFYSNEVKEIANELLLLCDQFDKELYNDMDFINNINIKCDNFLPFFVTSIMYCISNFFN